MTAYKCLLYLIIRFPQVSKGVLLHSYFGSFYRKWANWGMEIQNFQHWKIHWNSPVFSRHRYVQERRWKMQPWPLTCMILQTWQIREASLYVQLCYRQAFDSFLDSRSKFISSLIEEHDTNFKHILRVIKYVYHHPRDSALIIQEFTTIVILITSHMDSFARFFEQRRAWSDH